MASKAKKTSKSKLENGIKIPNCSRHDFNEGDISLIQKNLLQWYDKFQRNLPWRNIAKLETDANIRGYSVWVSEVMCQQTQVATVVPYYNKWMKKWPSVQDLAIANLEEVNQVWAGLGYYSRARRLSEGSKVIVNDLDGQVPQSVEDLMNLIPGIGRYTASAIASVAYQRVAGVVDGNVSRVLSRMKVIGSELSKPATQSHLWMLANKIVSKERPGDFNQGLMELGALICTPRNPKCNDCPVSSCCTAYSMVKEKSNPKGLENFFNRRTEIKDEVTSLEVCDIENVVDCHMCLSPNKVDFDVTLFPCKAKKKSSRIEKIGVVVIEKGNQVLMSQRPKTGLLAGLWEFPSIALESDSNLKEQKAVIRNKLKSIGVTAAESKSSKYISEVVHIFSHIHTTYVVEHLVLKNTLKILNLDTSKWMTREEINSAAVSTAMKKVLEAVNKFDNSLTNNVSSRKRKRISPDRSNQSSIKSFFNSQ